MPWSLVIMASRMNCWAQASPMFRLIPASDMSMLFSAPIVTKTNLRPRTVWLLSKQKDMDKALPG